VLKAAADLDALGEHDGAAVAYARAGDDRARGEALARAGNIDELEAVLSKEQARERTARDRAGAMSEIELFLAGGLRREACVLARRCGTDGRLVAEGLEARRVAGDSVRLTIQRRASVWLLGDEVLLGRAPDAAALPDGPRRSVVPIPSPGVSRNHLLIARRGADPVVRDLGSRHGTRAHGRPVSGEIAVGEGLHLTLGPDAFVTIRPEPPGIALTIAGRELIAPLGPAWLGIGRWRIERGDDAWLELVTDDSPPAYTADLRWAARATLLSGDRLNAARTGPVALTIEAGPAAPRKRDG